MTSLSHLLLPIYTVTLFQPHQPPFCTLLPQCFCMCRSLCLEYPSFPLPFLPFLLQILGSKCSWTWRPRATRRSWSTSRRSWGRTSESLGWPWRGAGIPSPEVGWTEQTGGREGCRGGGRRPFLLGAQGAEKPLRPLPWWLRPCPSWGLSGGP